MEGKSLLAMTLAIRMQPKAAGTLVICPSGRLVSSLFFRIFRKIFVPSDANQI
jgi:hypothetical protein